MAQIRFLKGTAAGYAGISEKDANAIYFCTDTHQIFVGSEEYTKGTGKLSAQPTSTTKGEHGKLYAYNGSLYLCEVSGSTYNWTRVANVNDKQGTVTSIGAGEGLGVASGSENPITSAGTLVHAVPSGAGVKTGATTKLTPAHGGSFNMTNVSTDKFGHVTAVVNQEVQLPAETPLNVSTAEGVASELAHGSTVTLVTGAKKGTNSHDLQVTTVEYTMPSETPLSISAPAAKTGTLTHGGELTVVTNVTQGENSHDIVKEVTKFTLPAAPVLADGETAGLVKSGGDVTITDGVITVNDDSHAHVIGNVDGLQAALDAKATPADISSAISTHNTSDTAHDDIRTSLAELAQEVNNFLDVDDTTRDQLSEVLALIDANKGTLDSLTSSKVNVADIVDNLTSTAANKPLSAKQGKALKDLIDGLQSSFDDHTHNYAGSATPGGSATSAVKLDTATAGSTKQPVYFTGGKPTAIGYTIESNVPANAKFTDTVYTHPTITKGDTTGTATPAHGGNFNVVESVTYDTNGHVSGVKTTTVTLPSQAAETPLNVTVTEGTETELGHGNVVTLVTGVKKGTNSHDLAVTTVDFTMPTIEWETF